MRSSLQIELPRDPAAASQARQLVVERFSTDLGRDELDTAKLLITELVNNAVIHGEGRITLDAELDADRFRVDVRDEGTGFVHQVRNVGFHDFGGRGLQIVDAESSRWGVYEGTTNVWFEVERSGPRLGTT